MKIVSTIMVATPLVLGVYFASTMASQAPQLVVTFARAVGLFMVACFIYLTVSSTFYAWIGGARKGSNNFGALP